MEVLIVLEHKLLYTLYLEITPCINSHFITSFCSSSSSSSKCWALRNFLRCKKSQDEPNEMMRFCVTAAQCGRALSWSKRMLPFNIPYLLLWMSWFFQCFITINCIIYCASGHELHQKIIVAVPEYNTHDLSCWDRLLEFLSCRRGSMLLPP